MLGATVVPIIHIYGPHEVSFILRQSGARVLVLPDRWRNIDYRERFDALVDVPALEHVVLAPRPTTQRPDTPDRFLGPRLAAHTPSTELPVTHPDDRCLLIYTSGTTADPKGVQHTANTLIAEIRSTAGGTRRADAGVNLAAFPAGHIAGVLGMLRMFVLGTSSVVMDMWDAALAARLVAEHGVTTTAGAPFYLASLMDEAERQGTTSPHFAQLHGRRGQRAAQPRGAGRRARHPGVPRVRIERAPGDHHRHADATRSTNEPGPTGALIPGNEIRLLDDDDREVGVGQDGEIVSRGPDLFIGYTDPRLDADVVPARRLVPHRRHRPPRRRRLPDHHRPQEGRHHPRRREHRLEGGRGPPDAAPGGDRGRRRRAARTNGTANGSPPSCSSATGDARPRRGAPHFAALGVAKQKTPEHLVLVDELPRTPSGKVRKVDLRDRLRAGTGADS